MNVCLFVCLFVLKRATSTVTRGIREQWSSPRTRDTHACCRAFCSRADNTCFKDLGLSPTSRMRSERFTATPPRRFWTFVLEVKVLNNKMLQYLLFFTCDMCYFGRYILIIGNRSRHSGNHLRKPRIRFVYMYFHLPHDGFSHYLHNVPWDSRTFNQISTRKQRENNISIHDLNILQSKKSSYLIYAILCKQHFFLTE